MNITWLGQGGYLIERANRRLVLDPYFSDALSSLHGLRRLVPPPFSIDELSPDAIFITHDHLDHFDPETLKPLLRKFPQSLLFGPKSVVDHGRQLDVEESRIIEVVVEKTVSLLGFTLRVMPAVHSDPHAVGLLVTDDDAKSVYISGDTLYDARLASRIEELAMLPLDAAFVCINGRLGNMNLLEAVDLVSELRPAVAVPMHYGMFAENTADPYAFVTACRARGQKTRVLEVGGLLQL